MNTQPEALRLADWLENEPGYDWNKNYCLAVAELRRLHEVNQMLVEAAEMALEALEHWMRIDTVEDMHIFETVTAPEAIAVLRQALEQPECTECNGMGFRDGVGDKCKKCGGEGAEPWDTTDMAHRPGGLSMEQEPVAWLTDREQMYFDKEDALRDCDGFIQPLYAAPVHAININKKCVDETAKDKHEPDAYGDGNVYRGQRSKDSTTKTLYYTDQEPVAWRTFDGEGNYEFRDYEMNEAYQEEWSKRNPKHQGWVEPLYAAPPRNSWFKLTDAEVWDEWVRAVDESNRSNRELAFRFARAIEAKLKEKNRG